MRAQRTLKPDLVGPVCESGDWLGARDRELVSKQATFAAFLSAGAYGSAMSSNYNTAAAAELADRQRQVHPVANANRLNRFTRWSGCRSR